MKLSGTWLLNLFLDRSKEVNFLQEERFSGKGPLNELELRAREIKLTMEEQLSAMDPLRELLRTLSEMMLSELVKEGGKEPMNLLELAENLLSFRRL